ARCWCKGGWPRRPGGYTSSVTPAAGPSGKISTSPPTGRKPVLPCWISRCSRPATTKAKARGACTANGHCPPPTCTSTTATPSRGSRCARWWVAYPSGSRPFNPGADAPVSMAKTPDEPLTLTVHSLPTPDRGDAERVAATRAGRWKMLAILLVCAAPVIASYLTYYVIRPEGRRNYGELIATQPLPPAIEGRGAQGRSVPLTSLKDQWLLVSVADSACEAACEKHLYRQRQLRETLGREKDRLDWVWLRT